MWKNEIIDRQAYFREKEDRKFIGVVGTNSMTDSLEITLYRDVKRNCRATIESFPWG